MAFDAVRVSDESEKGDPLALRGAATLLAIGQARFRTFGFKFDRVELDAICEVLFLHSQNEFLTVPEIDQLLVEQYGLRLSRYRLNRRLLTLRHHALVDLTQHSIVDNCHTLSSKLPVLPCPALFQSFGKFWDSLMTHFRSGGSYPMTPKQAMEGISTYVECQRELHSLLKEGALTLTAGGAVTSARQRKQVRDFRIDDTVWLTLAVKLLRPAGGTAALAAQGLSFDDIHHELAQWQFVPTDNLRRVLKLLSDETRILAQTRPDGRNAMEYRPAPGSLPILVALFGKLQAGPFRRLADYCTALAGPPGTTSKGGQATSRAAGAPLLTSRKSQRTSSAN